MYKEKTIFSNANQRLKVSFKALCLALSIFLAITCFMGCSTDSQANAAGGLDASLVSSTTIAEGNTALTSAEAIAKQYSEEDLDSSWDAASAVTVTLNGSSISVNGSGATASGSVLTISQGGTYVLSGTLSNGQIVIAAADTDTVKLVLNGVNITNKTGAPIYASTSDKVIITLAEGTENTVTDGGESFAYADADAEEPDAAIFSKDDLTINGLGTLTVNAGFNNGIGTKDDLILASGTIIVDAANHGIRGRDSVTVVDADITITAGNDGIQSNNDEKENKGWIYLEGGTYNITSANDGIQAETVLAVAGGVYNIVAGGGAAEAAEIVETNNMGPGGGGQMPEDGQMTERDQMPEGQMPEGGQMPERGQMPEDGQMPERGQMPEDGQMPGNGGGQPSDSTGTQTATSITTEDTETSSESYKGLKAKTDLAILGGTFTIDSADDSIHSNSNIAIIGGTFTLSTGDDAIHGDADVSVTGGEIKVLKSYEGLEGATVNIYGGTIDIISSDDGINAAGGSDGTTMGNFNQDSFAERTSYYVNIYGGIITLNAGGDGIDSNGNITISGGTITALVDTTRDNEAIDCDGTFVITGGTLINGGTNTGRTPGTDSTQSYIYLDTGITAGTEITVKDGSKTIVSFTLAIDCQYLAISSPEITSGKSYDVYQGSTLLSAVTAGTGGSDRGGQGGQGGQGGEKPTRTNNGTTQQNTTNQITQKSQDI